MKHGNEMGRDCLVGEVCGDSAQLLDFQILHIEHVSEFGKTSDNLFDLRLGQLLDAVHDLVLDWRRGIPSKRSARFCQFDSNDATIRRIPEPGHERALRGAGCRHGDVLQAHAA